MRTLLRAVRVKCVSCCAGELLHCCVIYLAVLSIGAWVFSELEACQEEADAVKYLQLLSELHDSVTNGTMTRKQYDDLRYFTEKPSAVIHVWTNHRHDARPVQSTCSGQAHAAFSQSLSLENEWRDCRSVMDCWHPNWSFHGSFLFVVSLVTTIGYGSYTPQTKAGKTAVIIVGIVGIPLHIYTSMLIGQKINGWVVRRAASMGRHLRSVTQRFSDGSLAIEMRPASKEISAARGSISGRLGSGRLDDHLPVKNACSLVAHVFIILIALSAVIVVGAVLFSTLNLDPAENEESLQSFFNSVYFCFVTLSTVGFGDYAPSTAEAHQLKLLAFVLWIAIGVSITSSLIVSIAKRMESSHELALNALTSLLGSSEHNLEDVEALLTNSLQTVRTRRRQGLYSTSPEFFVEFALRLSQANDDDALAVQSAQPPLQDDVGEVDDVDDVLASTGVNANQGEQPAKRGVKLSGRRMPPHGVLMQRLIK